MNETCPDIEPLEPELWFAALEKLSRRQAKADGASVESLLRQAFHLLQLAPRPLRTVVRCEVGEDSFENLLECGAFESAAIALVATPARFSLRCAAGTQRRIFHASVSLPGQTRPPATARSENAASALVGAWANCLMDLTQQSIEDPAPHPLQHTQPVELRPKSIEP